MDTVARALLNRWRGEGVKLRPGATPDDLRRLEARIGHVLPNDMQAFYAEIDGMETDESDAGLNHLNSLAEIEPFNAGLADANARTLFTIGDHSMNGLIFVIDLGQHGYGQVFETNGHEFETFTDFTDFVGFLLEWNDAFTD